MLCGVPTPIDVRCPPSQYRFFLCGVPTQLAPCLESMCSVPPPIGTLFRNMCGVPTSRYTLFLCGVPPPLQVPACKMKPSSTCILKCGTPSSACSKHNVGSKRILFQKLYPRISWFKRNVWFERMFFQKKSFPEFCVKEIWLKKNVRPENQSAQPMTPL